MELTVADKLLEIAGWLILVMLWMMIVINYSNIPDTIPTHYNFAGKPDGFGSKGTIFILPIIGSVLFIGMTILNKFAHIFNYPTKITDLNAVKQYTIATSLIRYLKFMIVLAFSFIVLITFQAANNQLSGLGTWFLPVLIGLFFIPWVYAIVGIYKAG